MTLLETELLRRLHDLNRMADLAVVLLRDYPGKAASLNAVVAENLNAVVAENKAFIERQHAPPYITAPET